MPRILLVRHGQASATYTDDLDPGLSDLGRSQAEFAAENLKSQMPLALISSPLKRARETAAPLSEMFGASVSIENRISEIPSPGLALEERGPWLRGVMQGVWSDQDDALISWRSDLLNCLMAQKEDCVMFSHFVAINVATGLAIGADEVTLFRPDNASMTELNNDNDELSLVRRGDEADTTVN